MAVSAQVFIWLPSGAQWGHAAMEIYSAPPTYMSWWPEASGKEVSTFSVAPGVRHPGALVPDLATDKSAACEGRRYDWFCFVQNLNVQAMAAFVNSQNADDKHWRAIHKNCCTMVYRTLRAGGAPKAPLGMRVGTLFGFSHTAGALWTPRRLMIYLMGLPGVGSMT